MGDLWVVKQLACAVPHGALLHVGAVVGKAVGLACVAYLDVVAAELLLLGR